MEFYKRIGYEGTIDDISLVICKDFNLGEFVSNKLIEMGYEDFNFILETTEGKYFIKIFSNFRNDNNCQRYVDVMLKVNEAGVTFPRLFKSVQGHLHITRINNTKIRFCVMEYIDGDNFFSFKRKPNSEEIRYLAHQTALINSIDIKPEFVYDSWAIVNFPKEYEKIGKYLLPEDKKMIKPLIKDFENMKIHELPHCFVHGDIIATNIMKGKKIWIIDIAVSNYYPRIQELAVLACNLLFNETSKEESEKNLKIALEEYQKIIKLTPRELDSLPTYIKLAHAMHILQANYEKIIKKNDLEENEYWLQQGRSGLKQMI